MSGKVILGNKNKEDIVYFKSKDSFEVKKRKYD